MVPDSTLRPTPSLAATLPNRLVSPRNSTAGSFCGVMVAFVWIESLRNIISIVHSPQRSETAKGHGLPSYWLSTIRLSRAQGRSRNPWRNFQRLPNNLSIHCPRRGHIHQPQERRNHINRLCFFHFGAPL